MKILMTSLLLLTSISAHALECNLTCEGITAGSQRILDAQKIEKFNELTDVNCRMGGSIYGANPALQKLSFVTLVTADSKAQAALLGLQACSIQGKKLEIFQAVPVGSVTCSGAGLSETFEMPAQMHHFSCEGAPQDSAQEQLEPQK